MKRKQPAKINTKEAQKPIEEGKAVALPLNAEEQAQIDKWRMGEKESQVPFRFGVNITPEATSFDTKSVSDRGSEVDKQCLVNATFCAATGAKNVTFATRLFTTCAPATGLMDRNKPEELVKNSDAVLDALYSIKPQDEIEGMLVTKLIALHFQGMNYLALSSDKNASPQQKEIHLNRATKLIRLYNETLEAFTRYRRKGEQKVLVQHVNVEQGGQAICGNVQAGGGVSGRNFGG